MRTRPATPADIPEITEVQRRWETAWFGAPEEDEDEVRESFARIDAPDEQSRAVIENDHLVAVAWWQGADSTLIVDPDAAVAPLYADLLPWLARQPGVEAEALNRDTQLQAALAEHGWQHVRSSFELLRAVTPDWVIAEPSWPDGVAVRVPAPDDATAMHRLIYVDSGWAEIPGHHERGFDEWRGIFVTERDRPEEQVLAWRGDRLIGLALGHTFSDGTGWISQLAVARDERGRGLGRALLLEALRRRRDGGATSLGLGVSQDNRGALDLYLGVGLELDREWLQYVHPS